MYFENQQIQGSRELALNPEIRMGVVAFCRPVAQTEG